MVEVKAESLLGSSSTKCERLKRKGDARGPGEVRGRLKLLIHWWLDLEVVEEAVEKEGVIGESLDCWEEEHVGSAPFVTCICGTLPSTAASWLIARGAASRGEKVTGSLCSLMRWES